MTALKEFEKIEATAIWRADENAQRRDVIITLGDATLTLFDMQERVLAHWSIPAIARANPGELPAVFHPDGDPNETLELGEDSDLMIDAIEKLRKAVERRRPHPGRLRLTSALVMISAIAALGVFWLPDAVRHQTITALPEVKQREIGAQIVDAAARFTGSACHAVAPDRVLRKIAIRLFPGSSSTIVVVPDGLQDVIALPGHHYVVGRALVEDHETPEVLAGFLIAERIRTNGSEDLIRDVLDQGGLIDNLRLLTTGNLPEGVAASYAELLLSQSRTPLIGPEILPAFSASKISSRPYAYAVDVTGETTLDLIEADPMAGRTPPAILSDSEWVELQGICEK